MPVDQDFANRIREELDDVDGITEKAMFGGLAFLLHGNMAVGIMSTGDLMVRHDETPWQGRTTVLIDLRAADDLLERAISAAASVLAASWRRGRIRISRRSIHHGRGSTSSLMKASCDSP